MTDRNKQLSQIFHELASMYRFLEEEKPFRALAYQRASQAIQGLTEDISFYVKEDSLNEIPGIGESLEKDIREFEKTGHVKRYDKLKRKLPYGLIELMDISGFGPQSLKKLNKELNVKSKEEVIAALQDGRVGELKGFGSKKIENMLRGLKLHKGMDRMLLWDAMEMGEKVISALKDHRGIKRIELAGSLRRRKETVGDFDILAVVSRAHRKKVADHFTASTLAQKTLAKGITRASIILKENGKQGDLRMVDESEWGAALLYFTGSKEHNIHLRTLARDQGYRISEYGVFTIDDNKRIAGKTEEEIYQTLGMQFIPPEMREEKGEIELAVKHNIPELVKLSDVKGDLHIHSNWSDGLQTLEELVQHVQKKYSYDYIAITDHSKSERVAGGMNEEEFLKQLSTIRELNEKMGKNFLKAGVEVDILADGSLDLSDDVLGQFDWVIASIHSGFKRNNTVRLIKACEHPYVHCIGHPTGRIIGKRDPYPVDSSELLKVAKKTGTALEVNAQPFRMDMSEEFVRQARESEVMIVVNTDSHKFTDFNYMQMGIDIARRGWCTADNILNTRSWKEIQHLFKKKLKYA